MALLLHTQKRAGKAADGFLGLDSIARILEWWFGTWISGYYRIGRQYIEIILVNADENTTLFTNLA